MKFYRDEPNTNSWEKINSIPPLCVSTFEFTSLSTIPSGWSTNWTVARFNEHRSTNEVVYNTWYSGVKSIENSNNNLKVREDRGRRVRVGTTPLTIGETSKVISFDYPMDDNTYVIFFNNNGLATSLGFANRTTNGFIMNISVGVTGTVAWLAVER